MKRVSKAFTVFNTLAIALTEHKTVELQVN